MCNHQNSHQNRVPPPPNSALSDSHVNLVIICHPLRLIINLILNVFQQLRKNVMRARIPLKHGLIFPLSNLFIVKIVGLHPCVFQSQSGEFTLINKYVNELYSLIRIHAITSLSMYKVHNEKDLFGRDRVRDYVINSKSKLS
jgi:hypothetical protein